MIAKRENGRRGKNLFIFLRSVLGSNILPRGGKQGLDSPIRLSVVNLFSQKHRGDDNEFPAGAGSAARNRALDNGSESWLRGSVDSEPDVHDRGDVFGQR